VSGNNPTKKLCLKKQRKTDNSLIKPAILNSRAALHAALLYGYAPVLRQRGVISSIPNNYAIPAWWDLRRMLHVYASKQAFCCGFRPGLTSAQNNQREKGSAL